MKHELDNIVMNAVKKAIYEYNEENGSRYELDDCGSSMFIVDRKTDDEYCLSLEDYDG